MIKDTKELRRFLLARMEDVIDGKIECAQARAICTLSQQIYNTLNIELKAAQAKTVVANGAIKPVTLG
jgi:hypothetical protein